VEVVVVGGGAYGLACADHLARAGANVVLVESVEPGHEHAASGGLTRVLRLEYGEARRYSELTARAIPVWRALESWSGETLFVQRGVVHVVQGEGAFERASWEVVGALGFPVELLEPTEVARRWPAINVDDLSFALYSPSGGFVWARRATRVLAARARDAGVDIRAPARAVSVAAGTVLLEDGEALQADQVCLCCGASSARLDPRLAGVVALRQTILYLAAQVDVPVFADDALDAAGPPSYHYGVPSHDGLGFKIGRHDLSEATPGDPDDPRPRAPREDEVEALRRHAAHRFPPVAGAPVAGAEICFYETTADQDPILDRLDEHTVACCGLSGHGFKFAPVLARAAADLVLGREPAIDVRGFERTRPALHLDSPA
jgi:glycine/D-amino acid oxidase-like deaminating enzyme